MKNKFQQYFTKAATLLREDSGEGHVNLLISVIIVVVIGGVLLSLAYAAFQNDWFPGITSKVNDMLGYSG